MIMKLFARLFPVGGPSLAVVLGLLFSSCGDATPNAPTSPPVAGQLGATPGATSSFSRYDDLELPDGRQRRHLRIGERLPRGRHQRGVPGAGQRPSGAGPVGEPVGVGQRQHGHVDLAGAHVAGSRDLLCDRSGVVIGRDEYRGFDTGSTATTLTVTGVPAGTYFVRVLAKNSSGSSAPSNEIVLTVGGGPSPCTTAPGVPTGLSAAVSGASVTLTWTAPAGGCPPSTYGVEAGSTSGASNLASVFHQQHRHFVCGEQCARGHLFCARSRGKRLELRFAVERGGRHRRQCAARGFGRRQVGRSGGKRRRNDVDFEQVRRREGGLAARPDPDGKHRDGDPYPNSSGVGVSSGRSTRRGAPDRNRRLGNILIYHPG